MAPRAKCPKCGEVRIDKGTEIIWLADCPICGQTINSEKEKSYPIPEEDSFIPPDDDSSEVKYKTKGEKS